MKPGDERLFVGLGANQGDAASALVAAFASLDALPGTRVVARSSLYLSTPVEAGGPDFHNAVAELRSTLDPPQLLQQLHAIEQAAGRTRPYPNAPRPLDLDLLLYGTRVVAGEALTLPHPRLQWRAFVLEPLAEIDAALVVPGLGPIAPWRVAAASQRVLRLP